MFKGKEDLVFQNSVFGTSSNIDFKEKSYVKGEVQIIEKTSGKVIFQKHNVITNLGKENFAKLLSGDCNYAIQKIQLGTGHHNGDPINGVYPPTPNQTHLDHPVFEKDVQRVDFPSSNQVRFEIDLELNEANGSGTVAYTELGLISRNGRLVAYETTPSITKTNKFAYTIRWTITFA